MLERPITSQGRGDAQDFQAHSQRVHKALGAEGVRLHEPSAEEAHYGGVAGAHRLGVLGPQVAAPPPLKQREDRPPQLPGGAPTSKGRRSRDCARNQRRACQSASRETEQSWSVVHAG